MRLVLDFLKTTILKSPHAQTGQAIKTTLLADLVSFITLKSAKPTVKSALTSLDYFLQKSVLYLSDVIDTFQRVHGVTKEHIQSWEAFISKIFQWMQMKNIWPIAGKLLATILSSPWAEGQDTRFLSDSWHNFLHAGLTSDIELLEPIQLYTFMPLFASDKEQMLKYLDYLFLLQDITKDQSTLDVTSMIWLAALEAGKKAGVVGEPLSGTYIIPPSRVHVNHLPASAESAQPNSIANLQKVVLEDILSHSSQEARSSAVSILIASPSTAKPYSPASLELLQRHLPAFHADSDAKFRYDVLGYSRNMIARMLGAIAGIDRDIERKAKKSKNNDTNSSTATDILQLRHLLKLHRDFLRWYFGFLKQEMVPTASYQRHITTLKAMGFILKSYLRNNTADGENSEGAASLVNISWLRSVLDLIMDPFDDVRETAASLLILLSSKTAENAVSGLSKPMLQELEEFCARASKLASKTSRADHSDGVARSYEVLCRWTTSTNDRLAIPSRLLAEIEEKLTSAEKDLALAVLEAPIHGAFAALR